ncbi:MAG: cytochrome c oxidase assembly protein [Jatrophihabitantaceae bacterium]
MTRSRPPALAVAAWALAVAGLAVLGVAVALHLHSGSSTGNGMHMHGAGAALARAGGDPAGPLLGSHLLSSWQLDSIALAVLVLLAAAYLTGVALAPIRSGARWPVRRTVAFLLGLAVCVFATSGSIAVYDQVLFTAHMAGHLALVMVAPVLLVAGHPLSLALAAATPRRRDRIARVVRGRVVSLLTAPPVALASYTVVIVGSHLTGLMDVVMRTTWAGQVEHLVYLLVGCQFFVLVVGQEPIRWRLGTPARWLLLAVAMAVDTFTGIVLLQGTHVVAMLHTPDVAVDPLSDTRTGGAIMWFGGDAIMIVVMVVLVAGWLRRVDTDRADKKGWLEQARVSTFTARTSGPGEVETFDEDEDARESYNAWLAGLDKRG